MLACWTDPWPHNRAYPEYFEHIAIRVISAEFIPRSIEAKHELLWLGRWPKRCCVHIVHVSDVPRLADRMRPEMKRRLLGSEYGGKERL